MKETESQILKNRAYILRTFKNRFDYMVKSFKDIEQGSHVEVDLSNLKSSKFKDVDSLLVISIRRDCKSFIGMTGSLGLLELPISCIKN